VRHEVLRLRSGQALRLRAFPSTLRFDATGGPSLGMTGSCLFCPKKRDRYNLPSAERSQSPFFYLYNKPANHGLVAIKQNI